MNTTELFSFFDKNDGFYIEKYEVSSIPFRVLCTSLRNIVLLLIETESELGQEIGNRIRILVSEYLTVPIPFTSSLTETLQELFPDVEMVRRLWGSDLAAYSVAAINSSIELQEQGNLLRKSTLDTIDSLLSSKESFKIFCHRRAREYFDLYDETQSNEDLNDEHFLYTLRDYNSSDPFDTLIKVGPMRTKGWGSAPDALITSPRFKKLIQITWRGSLDENGFGYDPVSLLRDEDPLKEGARVFPNHRNISRANWQSQTNQVGDNYEDAGVWIPGEDDLQILTNSQSNDGRRSAILAQVDDLHGILYPPLSQILSYDNDFIGNKPFSKRLLNETLLEGMFIIHFTVDDVDLGGIHAKHGRYSELWKDKLNKRWRNEPEKLLQHLKEKGLELLYMRTAIRNWCEPPSSVIHAPQRSEHFRILWEVLDVESESIQVEKTNSIPIWAMAWKEIRRSRGEAIQTGYHEHEIVEEHLIEILENLLPEIKQHASRGIGFRITLPVEFGIQGECYFYRVQGIEEHFTVPESEFKIIRELSLIDQWRN